MNDFDELLSEPDQFHGGIDTVARELAATETSSKLLVPIGDINPAEIFKAGGTSSIVAAIEAKARSFDLDISTAKGRALIKSVARKIASSKTFLDDAGKNFVGAIKKQAGEVDAERRRMREQLEALQEDIRRPLTEFEERDTKRIEGHERALAEMCELFPFDKLQSTTEIDAGLVRLDELNDRQWLEFSERAGKVYRNSRSAAMHKLTEAKKREEEAAELARLRTEAAERAQKDRDERIAREAADRAQRDAEARAKAEADRIAREAAEREQRAKDESAAHAKAMRDEAERQIRELAAKDAKIKEAEAKARQAEADRIAAESRGKAQRETDARRAEEARIKAETKAKADADAAVEHERWRVKSEREAKEAAESKRQADLDHRAKIEFEAFEALEAIIETGYDGNYLDPHIILNAIKRGEIPNVKILY